MEIMLREAIVRTEKRMLIDFCRRWSYLCVWIIVSRFVELSKMNLDGEEDFEGKTNWKFKVVEWWQL